MSIPVACYSCGKIIGTVKIHVAAQEAKNKEDFQKLFKQFKIEKICCKTTIMTYVPVIDKLVK